MKTKVVRTVTKNGFISTKFENAQIVEDMAQRGYSFVGYIPAEVEGYGRISAIDLVFEKKGEDNE